MMSRIPLLAVVALALTGCGDDSPEKDADVTAADGAGTRPPPNPALAAQGLREPLVEEDIAGAALRGELGCSFTQDGGRGPLLVAMADVMDEARADGVLKLGPATLRLRGADAGGFNAMVYGTRFTSGDLEVRIAVTSRIPRDDSESPPLPARLEIGSPAGVQQIEGAWACGP